MEEDVEKNLGPLHREVVMHIFSRLGVAMRDLDMYYVPGLGRFGPYKPFMKRMCEAGIIREGKEAICEKL